MHDVNRWDFDLRDGLRITDFGDWVRYDDHAYAMGKEAAALSEAQATIARLEAALRPFAEAIRTISRDHLSGHVSDDDEYYVRVGDLQRAYDTLVAVSPREGEGT